MISPKTLLAGTAGTGAVLLLLIAMSVMQLDLRGATTFPADCVGKPYGWPGCPSKSTASSVPETCGNSYVDPGEQCDDGSRFNGQTACSKECTYQQCGDGKVWLTGSEECEAPAEEYYAQDANGNMLIERKYAPAPVCGTYCLPPQCDGKTPCFSGCKWVFGPSCESIQQSSSSQAPVSLLEGPPTDGGQNSSGQLNTTENVSSSSSSVFISPTCGNGIVETGEECDDANKIDTDGCTSICFLPRCGDGIVQFTEQCDDGNTNNIDACSNACKRAQCGDAIVQAGEECDDGNQDAFDACTNTCRVPRCGDGVVQVGEECDDGNKTETDSCSNACKFARCGDGMVQDGEECDDGNQSNNDACTSSCKAPKCGDGFRQNGEQCDDGNQNEADACTSFCRFPQCGNGVTEGPEECDDGNQNPGDACTNACRRARCGDGIVSFSEECDAGRDNSNVVPDACRLSCKKAFCGDYVMDQGEECDGTAACTLDCKLRDGIIQPVGDVGGPGLNSSQISIVIGAIVAAAASIAGVVYRKVLFGLAKRLFSKTGARSIEDIPLDQIEMPWHKW